MKKQPTQSPFKLKGANRIQALKLIQRLYEIPRTGWFDRGVKNPETVGEHIDATVELAERFFPYINDLDKMLKIHDWPESKDEVGDIRTDKNCPDDHRWTKENKYMAEYKAMKEICSTMGKSGKKIFKLWLEYAERKTERAKIAKEIDLLQRIKKAVQYEKQGEPVNAHDFIQNDQAKIGNPRLVKELEKTTMRLLSFSSAH